MADFFKEAKLTRSDIRGAITICVVILTVVAMVALTRQSNSQNVTKELNDELTSRPIELKITEFDPNTVELRELLSFGLTKYEALSIVRYRAAGKVFNIKEELIACYGISDSLYFALEPFIAIGEEYQYKTHTTTQSYTQQRSTQQSTQQEKSRQSPRISPSPFLIDTVGIEYLTAIGALSKRQAEVLVKWREVSGIRSLEELKACYTVSDSVANWMAQYVIFTEKPTLKNRAIESKKRAVELNTADSIELTSVYGIGAKTAAAIIDYREKLGGFHSKEQLAEIKIITEGNFERIIEQISVNNCDISKIDINFATAKELSRHPYFTSLKIRRLLKLRELKGGWRTLEEMIEDDIFTLEEAQRVRPYLHFEVLNPI